MFSWKIHLLPPFSGTQRFVTVLTTALFWAPFNPPYSVDILTSLWITIYVYFEHELIFLVLFL